ncbi:Transcriptional regulator [Collimonas arenae]|uniref:Transcriptional regulator n=1 Tax=Collimonas arenae TaxID=279058 RepID=A0A0A1FGQ4_9BURK|nr:TetR/AcrR family transcriptional regulator [Collimonas arenae]AIY42900.1 Transcriptional regulator [Collimonas arenae]
MDNTTRSERSRSLIIQAALAIIVRDGPGRLTLDAIAREGGISKGGVMHQFGSKAAVLKALLEHQAEYFEKFSQDYMAKLGPATPEAQLATQIAVAREAINDPQSIAFAILGGIGEDPSLLSMFRENDAKKIEAIQGEAADPELATLRWAAARGLLLTSILGLCPLSKEERERLFDRLLDGQQWSTPLKT